MTQAKYRLWFTSPRISTIHVMNCWWQNYEIELYNDRLTAERRRLSALLVATSGAYVANYILKHIVTFELATPVLQIARGKLLYTQWTIWSVKRIHCDNQISRFEPWIAIVGLSNPSQMRWPRETYVGTRRSVIHSSVTPFIVWRINRCVCGLVALSFLQCRGKVVISSYADTTLWWVWGWLKQ